MMIDKRLIGIVGQSRKYIAGNVAYQWCALLANLIMMIAIANLLTNLYQREFEAKTLILTAAELIVAIAIRFYCALQSSRMSYLSSKTVKKTLRRMIYEKLLRLGTSYNERIRTSEIVQIAVEGVEQLETYFGAYLPQFAYAMLAPLTLFAVLSFVNFPSAVVLLICVPMIPAAIAAVQTWAKKLLAKYWGQYTALSDTFLENLQGLTTLKIYRADEYKNEEMNVEAEKFRKITMKVLVMQLNSITIMDLIAYGGAALGVIMAITQFIAGNVGVGGCLLIILLSADFFIPMRLLGSFFHIAMNGMAASGKIFALLDLDEPNPGEVIILDPAGGIMIEGLDFAYEAERPILKDVRMDFPIGSFSAIVGESGCGKSTVAAILMGRNKDYKGSVMFCGSELKRINEDELMRRVTYVSHQSYLFKGTVRDNLLMGRPDASDRELWAMLERVKLGEFLRSENGLDTFLIEKGTNFSGGQCQRLALARALLHDSAIYIFDEATSNIDIESETDIIREIHALAQTKTIVLISHRLANVIPADQIYVMDQGVVVESGRHETLLANQGIYQRLWTAQQNLENFTNQGANA